MRLSHYTRGPRQSIANYINAEYGELPGKEKNMTSDLLSVDESAAFLKLKSSTLRDWILHRRIPFVKMGRRVLLRRSDLEALIDSSVIRAGGTRTHGK